MISFVFFYGRLGFIGSMNVIETGFNTKVKALGKKILTE